MSYSTDRARIEQNLATAHRALWRARTAAEHDGDQTLEWDLAQLQAEVQRLAENSLRGRARKSVLNRGQMSLQQTDGL